MLDFIKGNIFPTKGGNLKRKPLLFLIQITLILLACSPPGSASTNTPQLAMTQKEQGESDFGLTIPISPGQPPSDIFEQIAFYATGGGEPNCPCVSTNDSSVDLQGFNPNTEYLLTAYKVRVENMGTATELVGYYAASWEIKVNSSGNKLIEFAMGENIDDFEFLVYSKDSPLVSSTSKFSPIEKVRIRLTENTIRPCGDSYETRLRIGMFAHVSNTPPLANNVRKTFLVSAPKLGQIQPGEKVIVVDGPGCSNGWIWWEVTSLETSLTGWTSEGDQKNYWLIPDN